MNCKDRFLGYKNALKDNGIKFNKKLVSYGGMHEIDGSTEIDNLIKNKIKFDAVFAVNDPVAIGASESLKKHGVNMPKDVALVGFSNNPITEYVTPSITTVEQPAFEMGKLAATILISLIKNEMINRNSKVIKLNSKLILRKSA